MQVNMTKFSKNLTDYLNMAGAGEEVFIVSRGRVIARIMPPLKKEQAANKKPVRQKQHSIGAMFEELRQLCVSENYQMEIPNRCNREDVFLAG